MAYTVRRTRDIPDLTEARRNPVYKMLADGWDLAKMLTDGWDLAEMLAGGWDLAKQPSATAQDTTQ